MYEDDTSRPPSRSLFPLSSWRESIEPSSQQNQRDKKCRSHGNEVSTAACLPANPQVRPRRHERYSGDDRQHGQAERVSAAGSPSLRIGVSRQSHHPDIGRMRSRRLARRAARGTHTGAQAHTRSGYLEKAQKSPVNAVIQSHSCSLPGPVRFASPAMTSYQAFLKKAPAVVQAAARQPDRSLSCVRLHTSRACIEWWSPIHCPFTGLGKAT